MTVYQLESITICKGSALNPVFTFYNKDGSKPNYNGFDAWFILSRYGFEDENVFSKMMTLTEDNKFEVLLNTSDTDFLEAGAYTMKLVLVDESDNQHKFARGVFNVLLDTTEVAAT